MNECDKQLASARQFCELQHALAAEAARRQAEARKYSRARLAAAMFAGAAAMAAGGVLGGAVVLLLGCQR